MPSGKQILLGVLSELTQGTRTPPVSPEISDKVRAGFLLHGSTASESWSAIEHIQWSAENDAQGNPVRCGITYDRIFLTDLFEELTCPEGVPLHLASKYPGLTPERYHQAVRFIWLVLSSVQWFECLASVEDEADIKTSSNALLADYIRKLHHFREHPEDFR